MAFSRPGSRYRHQIPPALARQQIGLRLRATSRDLPLIEYQHRSSKFALRQPTHCPPRAHVSCSGQDRLRQPHTQRNCRDARMSVIPLRDPRSVEEFSNRTAAASLNGRLASSSTTIGPFIAIRIQCNVASCRLLHRENAIAQPEIAAKRPWRRCCRRTRPL